MSSRVSRNLFFSLFVLMLLPELAACGDSTVNAAQPRQTIALAPGFQMSLSPMPTIPPYRCGVWASTNAPDRSATITIYSRLTHDIAGVEGKTASATAHFQNGDMTLPQATSDAGGYVSFTLPLAGRQPANVPATVDVTFTGLPRGPLNCTPAFFTPR